MQMFLSLAILEKLKSVGLDWLITDTDVHLKRVSKSATASKGDVVCQ